MVLETSTDPVDLVGLVGVLGAWRASSRIYSRPVQSIKALALSPNPNARAFSADPDYMEQGGTARWLVKLQSTGDPENLSESGWVRRSYEAEGW